jgi:hypothetical protein
MVLSVSKVVPRNPLPYKPYRTQSAWPQAVLSCLPWKKIEHPGQSQSDADKFRKNFDAIKHPLSVRISRNHTKYYRDERRKQDHYRKVYQGFLPARISKASSIDR